MSDRVIPDAVLARAARRRPIPAASAWVSANAGSGKTHVLAQRVIRLLLDGTDPAKILCLTFTKAAAANMANRVFDTLARLDRARRRRARHGNPRDRRQARRRRSGARGRAGCSPQALETPGGLKVQTIHAFCTRLLQQFPFEADVAARFQVLEETQQKQMLETIRLEVLLEAAAKPDSAARPRARDRSSRWRATSTFQRRAGRGDPRARRGDRWLDRAGGIDGAMAELSRALGIDAGRDDRERRARDLSTARYLPSAEWPALAAICAQGSKTDQEQAERLRRSARRQRARAARRLSVDLLHRRTASRARASSPSSIRDKHPDLCAAPAGEQDRVCALLERRRAVDRARPHRRAAHARDASDRALSRREGRARPARLRRPDRQDAATCSARVSAAWVHYKLDLGIDHLLIDEAQDTSPEQWDIVERAGRRVRRRRRRARRARAHDLRGRRRQAVDLLVPGRRRRAKFDEMRTRLRARTSRPPSCEWRDVRVQLLVPLGARSCSTRSTRCSRSRSAYRGADRRRRRRPSHRGAAATPRRAWSRSGRWSSPTKARRSKAWDAPFDTPSETSPRVKLARQIAKTVAAWIEREDLSATATSAMRCGRATSWSWCASAGRCSRRSSARSRTRIAVAGADRLVLTEHIAVMDLLALADALLLPEDDLALADRAQEPAVRPDRGRLVRARAGTARASLRAALRERRPDDSRRGSTRSTRDARSALSPFAFYARPARRRRRPQALPRAARARGQRRARRIPQSRARL